MPVYNGERFLAAALASICGQTYRDFEFLVIDDGSTDTTPLILADASRRDSRIRIITQPANAGVVAARNAGLQQAQGRFIAVMDSDDVAVPERLARQTSYFEAHPDVAVLGGAVQLIDQDSVAGRTKAYPLEPALVAWSMLFFNSVAHSTVMIRRDALKGNYPVGGAEDYALLMELSLRVRMANLPDVLVRYRTWPGALTARTWERQEKHANEIVQGAITTLGIESITIDQVKMLRGLSRDQYPVSPNDIRATGELIGTLAAFWSERPGHSTADAGLIRRDAGVRLWLLATLASRRSPALAARLGARALRLSPTSAIDFASKVLKRLRT